MKATIKRDFDYSPDGIRLVRLLAGETHDIRADLFDGLLAAGYIAAGEAPVRAKAARETPAPVADKPSGPDPITSPSDPLDALDALEQGEEAAVRHIGRGKYAIFRGDERLTDDAMTKPEAEAALAAMLGA